MSTNNQQALSDISMPIFFVQSDKDDHFTGALAAGAHETEILTIGGGSAVQEQLATQAIMIHAVTLLTRDAISWRVIFWRSGFDSADADTDGFVTSLFFDVLNAYGITGGTYNYYSQFGSLIALGGAGLVTNPCPFAYVSPDGLIRISLQAVGAPKVAGAAGEAQVRLMYTPVGRTNA